MQTVSNCSQEIWYQVSYHCIIKPLKEIKRTAPMLKFTALLAVYLFNTTHIQLKLWREEK